MIQSEMIESKMNEMTINDTLEEEKNFIRVMDFIHVEELGIPILGTSFANLEWFPSNSLIGLKDLLRLIDKADEYGVTSLIRSIPNVMNEYNVMIILEKALHISPDLSEILILQAIDIIASNLPCVIGGYIYNNCLDLESIHIQAELWICDLKDRFDFISHNPSIASLLLHLKRNAIVNTLIELPSYIPETDSDSKQLPLLLRIFQSSHCRANTEQILAIIVVWILSCPFQPSEFLQQEFIEHRDESVHLCENILSIEFSKRLSSGISFVVNQLDLTSLSSTMQDQDYFDIFVLKILLSIASSHPQFKHLQHKINMCVMKQYGNSYHGFSSRDLAETFAFRIIDPLFTQLLSPEQHVERETNSIACHCEQMEVNQSLTNSNESSSGSSSNNEIHNISNNHSTIPSRIDHNFIQEIFSLCFTGNKQKTQKFLQENSLPLLFTILRSIKQYDERFWEQFLFMSSTV